ncbi:MAG: dimethylarginine dimethylaminohydrolase family protein [Planctomycetota bacterium]
MNPKPFGVPSAYGDLLRVIMHRPGMELDAVTDATLGEFNFDRPVDREAFVREYDVMLSLLQNHGAECLLLTDLLSDDEDALGYIRHRPNMTYTRDLASVFSKGAVLMGPHLRGRRGDQEMMGRAFRKLGVPILGAIEPPGYLEGGGVTLLGEDTVVASLCDRANETGTGALRSLLVGGVCRDFLEVPLPAGHVHIDGVFMVLDERLCLIHEATFDVYPCRSYTAGRAEPRHVMFREYLERRGFSCIPITEEERLGGHLNVVVTRRSKTAVVPKEATRVASEMEKRGWKVSAFPADEMRVGKGGVHCMTCPLLVS